MASTVVLDALRNLEVIAQRHRKPVMQVVALLPEGYFDNTYKFNTMAEANAFMHGVHVGAGSYGAGGVYSFVLPGDEKSKGELDDMRENSIGGSLSQEEFDKAWEAVNAKLASLATQT